MSVSASNSIRRATQLYRGMRGNLPNVPDDAQPDYIRNIQVIGNLLVTVHRQKARLARQYKQIARGIQAEGENVQLRHEVQTLRSQVLSKTHDWEKERSQRTFLEQLMEEHGIDVESAAMSLFDDIVPPDVAIAELQEPIVES